MREGRLVSDHQIEIKLIFRTVKLFARVQNKQPINNVLFCTLDKGQAVPTISRCNLFFRFPLLSNPLLYFFIRYLKIDFAQGTERGKIFHQYSM